ncbi:type VII secretion protein EccB [Actinoplanes aureus]|uniref:Type VII secretion protein EccB n=1 Tax=Actinoplanes aureus TaxID=2792083 RepID=A0A931CKU3_9ACTN|nr:type VII secretion protein EccB [Actinoplanes aureus]MBG0568098.1 type VII secretion protein EccB [Actinoplanes aureus]
MTSRRDQLQSYQFMNQRVISAFVMRETDPAQSPLRRGIGALFGGLMVAILVAAGFGIYGILTRTGTDRWRADGTVVVERETGASFIYLRDRLTPTLNFASAKLAAGRPNPPVYRVSAKELTDVPRGVTIGIAGAPASLPAPARQVRLPWTMCTVPGAEPPSVLLISSAGPAATDLGERGLLVTADDDIHLVVQGRKHQIRNARTTVPALFGAAQPIPVGTAWLNALPSGADIAPIPVGDRGDRSAAAPDFDNGDVLVTNTGSGQQFWLILDDGRAPITPLQQAVLEAAFPGEPDEISVNELTRIPESDALKDDPATQGPAAVPQLAPLAQGETACAITREAAKAPALTVGGSPAGFAAAIPTAGAERDGQPLADAVQVPAGRFALVRAPGGFLLITDTGTCHAVPSADILAMLGYSAANAIEVPPALVGTIPAGVTLDPAAAVKPVTNIN